jgi:hypothetical protein
MVLELGRAVMLGAVALAVGCAGITMDKSHEPYDPGRGNPMQCEEMRPPRCAIGQTAECRCTELKPQCGYVCMTMNNGSVTRDEQKDQDEGDPP